MTGGKGQPFSRLSLLFQCAKICWPQLLKPETIFAFTGSVIYHLKNPPNKGILSMPDAFELDVLGRIRIASAATAAIAHPL